MYYFITVLRALAACIITNAHYEGIYPIDILANGGLIGDVVFFAVSGYCLVETRLPFSRWYVKRLKRIYLPVISITLVYAILGFYSISWGTSVRWFIYPTYYHFIASIVLLYIPYYIVVTNQWLRERLLCVMGVIFVIWLVLYITVYDKSYYHIDNVYEPMIRFLFFESMLLGCYIRINYTKVCGTKLWINITGTSICFLAYFLSKMMLTSVKKIVLYQFVNQILIFVLLWFVFNLFGSIEERLKRMPRIIKKVISFVSDITLEIYLVQYVIIEQFRGLFPFPMNWLLLSTSIVGSAYLLHLFCQKMNVYLDHLVSRSAVIMRRK